MAESHLEELDNYIKENGEDLTIAYKENKNRTDFIYDTKPCILPGVTELEVEDAITTGDLTEDLALNDLVIKSAMSKVKTESKNIESAENEQRIKKLIIDMILYDEGEKYYQKYHYVMDGKTKRKVKRLIEKNYNAGKYNYLKTTTNLNEP